MLMSSCSANTVETVSQSRSFTSLVYVAHPFSSQQGIGEQAENILASSTAQLRLEGGRRGIHPKCNSFSALMRRSKGDFNTSWLFEVGEYDGKL